MRFTLSFFIVLGSSAAASDYQTWGQSGEWEILVNSAMGNGCFARRILEDKTEIQIGTVPNRNGGYFAAYNADWTGIRDSEFGVVEFDFSDAIFAGDAVAHFESEVPGGYAFFDNPAFVKEFAKRNSVTVSSGGRKLIDIDLGGSKKAIDAILACQNKQPAPSIDN
ncbi:hypothetical protein ROG8370_02726 [Roseovarius gaetbuli]|uniref:Uncharacterized protein n=1 Tax=Roseovarius gaetbuli TaxID=1356575 RepID=A0A1X6ZS90_9RHOB|nr:hypothetical protein [Roseovarius gaetbuli]SLN59307.1 hypothetical protein ROG8370_02726 [Roseovarius gaetbuli]